MEFYNDKYECTYRLSESTEEYQKDLLIATDIMLPDTSYFVSLASSDYVDYENNEFHYYYIPDSRCKLVYSKGT